MKIISLINSDFWWKMVGLSFLIACLTLIIIGFAKALKNEEPTQEEKPVQSIEIIFKDPKTFYRRDTLVIVETIKTDSTLFLVTDENTSITIKY